MDGRRWPWNSTARLYHRVDYVRRTVYQIVVQAMKVVSVEQNTPEWLELRQGKITGSKLGDIVVMRGNTKKIGFFQLVADRLGLDDGTEDGRDRGHETEEAAIAYFEKAAKKKVERDCGMWLSDTDDNIAISPDGGIKNKKGEYTEAVEVKCLGSARHIQAIYENKLYGGYWFQALQYFIVNEKLKTLYFVFYDPRVVAHPYHCIQIDRKAVQAEVDLYLAYQIKTLEEVDELAEKLAF